MHNWYSVFAILDCHGVWTELTIFRFMKLLLSKINSSIMVIMCYHWMNSALSLLPVVRERTVELVLMLAFVQEMLPVKECYCCSRYPDILSIRR